MDELEDLLMREAKRRHGEILPCRKHQKFIPFSKCFTKDNGKIRFWYNTWDGNTHLISADIKTGEIVRVAR